MIAGFYCLWRVPGLAYHSLRSLCVWRPFLLEAPETQKVIDYCASIKSFYRFSFFRKENPAN
jgi:hypothetical protein